MDIDKFKYKLGQTVYLDPTGISDYPENGRVVALILGEDEGVAYLVSVASGSQGVIRHFLSENEIRD